MHKGRPRLRWLPFVTLLAVAGLAMGVTTPARSASNEVLKIDTRFGPVMVVQDTADSTVGYIQHKGRKIEVGSSSDIHADREGYFPTAEGDVVVLSIPSGVRGMPSNYHVLLVNDSQFVEIGGRDFASTDGTFKATRRGNEIEFDLGWENRKPKKAFYRAGVVYVGSNVAASAATLPKQDCAFVLNTLADCRRECPQEDFMSMVVQRSFIFLQEKPVFKAENFFKICKATCKGEAFSTASARMQLCGY